MKQRSIGYSALFPIFIFFTLLLTSCDGLLPVEKEEYTIKKNHLSLNLLSPVKNSTFYHQVNFSWAGSEGIDQYHIQVSENQDFSSPLIVDEKNVTESTYQRGFTVGSYFWRVRYCFEGQWLSWSEAQTFQVTDEPLFMYSDMEFDYQLPENYIDYQWYWKGDKQPEILLDNDNEDDYVLTLGRLSANQSMTAGFKIEKQNQSFLAFDYKGDKDLDFLVKSLIDNQWKEVKGKSMDSYSFWRTSSPIRLPAGTLDISFELDMPSYGYGTAYLDSISIIDIPSEFHSDPGFENTALTDNSGYTFTCGGDLHPIVQNEAQHSGERSLLFPDVDNNDVTSSIEIELIIDKPVVISYWQIIENEHYAYLYFYIDGEKQAKESSYNIYNYKWGRSRSYFITNPGTHTIKWEKGSSYYYDNQSYLDDITITPLTVLESSTLNIDFTSSDDSDLFTMSGEPLPQWQETEYVDTPGALRIGGENIASSSDASFTLTVEAPGTLYFDYKMDSYSYSDDFIFKVDDTEQLNKSGDYNWTKKSVHFSIPGSYVLTWSYESYLNYDSKAWIDNIYFVED